MGNVKVARSTKLGAISAIRTFKRLFYWPRSQFVEVLQCKGLPFNHYKSRWVDLFSLYGLNASWRWCDNIRSAFSFYEVHMCVRIIYEKTKGDSRWSRPSDKRGTWSPKKIFFSPFGPQFGLKIRGGGARWRVPRASPLDQTLGEFHKKFDRTVRSYGTVQYFRCVHTELTNLLTNSRSRLCPIRDFKQIATATCTTRKSPKMTQCACLEMTFRRSATGSLRCHYGDGNENVKKAIGFG